MENNIEREKAKPRRAGGQTRDKYEDSFFAEAGKTGAKEAFSGTASNMLQSADDLDRAADVLEKAAKNNLFEPTGSGGSFGRAALARFMNPDIAGATAKFDQKAVEAMADSFKGSMSDRDVAIMKGAVQSDDASTAQNVRNARTIANLFRKNAEKNQIFKSLVASGISAREITDKMNQVDAELDSKYKIGGASGASSSKKAAAGLPTDKQKRLEELRAKQKAGTLKGK